MSRPDIYVLARFLERLAQPHEWTRTRLQAAVRLNYTLFARYLADLEHRGWAKVTPRDQESDLITLTPQGEAAWHGLQAWLATWLGQGKL